MIAARLYLCRRTFVCKYNTSYDSRILVRARFVPWQRSVHCKPCRLRMCKGEFTDSIGGRFTLLTWHINAVQVYTIAFIDSA